MKKLILLVCLCLFGMTTAWAQEESAAWEPRDLDAVLNRLEKVVFQLPIQEDESYLLFVDFLDKKTDELSKVVLYPNGFDDPPNPQAQEQVNAILISIADVYETLRSSFPAAAAAASVSVLISKFATYDVTFGIGTDGIQTWIAGVKDKKNLEICKKMIQHVQEDYDSLLEQ